MNWTMISRTVSTKGATLVYGTHGSDIRIESRRRNIPHANGVGFWEHTTYAVVLYGACICEKQRLKDAKEAAEEMILSEANVGDDEPIEHGVYFEEVQK